MLHKSKNVSLLLSLCVMSALLTPALTQADTSMVLAEAETGSVAARQAREQREALAKKAAERKARKAAEAQKSGNKAAAEAPKPAEEQKEE